jgi:hypothetical protein
MQRRSGKHPRSFVLAEGSRQKYGGLRPLVPVFKVVICPELHALNYSLTAAFIYGKY